jgi:3-oxoacyl-[acyl-carrier protein] reductase
MTNVEGKWAFITGAARGIGYLASIFMARQGCNLVLHSRSKEHTKKVLSEVRALGVEAYDVEAELTDIAAIESMLDEIERKGARIDIVLNNAGLQPGYRTDYFATPVSDFTIGFMVNTIAPAMICYRFLPKMIERGFGRIVNTTSGIRNDPHQAGYSAAKAALDKFTTDLAATVDGTDVIISLSDPGWCRTDMGGRHAPNSPESALPGVVVGVFINDRKSGRLFRAQEFTGMTLEEAVKKAENL